jgi:hypothetical protein
VTIGQNGPPWLADPARGTIVVILSNLDTVQINPISPG